mmetsp:Transcript_34686/g.79108  ORF Transcript_34686/g.79108 Transcript_34686/m.79108 type:complete len:508 (+) Transcript_34686:1-1524(+)
MQGKVPLLRSLSSRVVFDDVLDAIGVSSIQLLAVLTCGIGNAADATEILSIGYIITELDFDAGEKGTLSSSVFAGMLVGAIVLGYMSDKIGRRICLATAMGINCVCGVLFAACSIWAAPNQLFIWMATFRFGAGFGVGGAVPIVFSLAAELIPARRRGLYLVAGVAAFWMVGSVFIAAAAWILLGINRYHWTALAYVAAVPSGLCLILTCAIVPESPRFLLLHGRHSEAVSVLRRFASSAGRKHLVPDDLVLHFDDRGTKSESWMQDLKDMMLTLLRPPLRRIFVLQLVVFFTLNFGWYGLLLWFPTLFKDRGIEEENVFKMAFYVSAANLPGNILSALLADVVGRRRLLACSMFGAAVCSLGFVFADAQWSATLTACLFNGISLGAWNALDVMSSEMFPTVVRAVAWGLLSATGRLGALVAQYVIASLQGQSPALPLVTSCALMAVGSLAGFFLPEMTAVALQDTLPLDQETSCDPSATGSSFPVARDRAEPGLMSCQELSPAPRE